MSLLIAKKYMFSLSFLLQITYKTNIIVNHPQPITLVSTKPRQLPMLQGTQQPNANDIRKSRVHLNYIIIYYIRKYAELILLHRFLQPNPLLFLSTPVLHQLPPPSCTIQPFQPVFHQFLTNFELTHKTPNHIQLNPALD